MSVEETLLDDDDPLTAHLRRQPLPKAGARIVVITDSPDGSATVVVAPLVDWFAREDRALELRTVIVDSRRPRLDQAMAAALDQATLPLVLITTATGLYGPEHLLPLLEAIDTCDHVLGKRPVGIVSRLLRWAGSLP